MAKIDAVILAAGCSHRMGTNKLLLPLGGKSLLEQFLSGFPFFHFQKVIAVYSDERVAEILSTYPVTVVCNTDPGAGKSGSIRLGISKSLPGSGIMFSVADQPLLSTSTIERLLEAFSLNPERIIVPYNGGKQANPVIFPASFRKELTQLHDDDGGSTVVRKYSRQVYPVEIPAADEFIDIDTPDTYQTLLEKWTLKN